MSDGGSVRRISIIASQRMSGERHWLRSPRPQLMVARLSIMVTGQSELLAMPSRSCSAAMPMAMRVMPILVVM